jgi:arylsulfatase A-like enzyme
MARLATATFHPDRSPDLIIVQEPYWYLYKDMKKNAGMHGSPYPYDTHVPVLFFGPRIPAVRVATRVELTDVAPTIAAYLGMPAPSACVGKPLVEIVNGRSAARR